MKLLKVDDAQPGAKLAKDLLDLKGVLIFKAGATLTADYIEKIKARRITHLFIETEEDAATGAGLSPEQIDRAIDDMFTEAKAHPVMAALSDAAKRYLKAKVG